MPILTSMAEARCRALDSLAAPDLRRPREARRPRSIRQAWVHWAIRGAGLSEEHPTYPGQQQIRVAFNRVAPGVHAFVLEPKGHLAEFPLRTDAPGKIPLRGIVSKFLQQKLRTWCIRRAVRNEIPRPMQAGSTGLEVEIPPLLHR
jgi:hypothetical protein